MAGASPLGNLVVSVTANVVGLTQGLNSAFGLLTFGFARMVGLSQAGSLRIVQAFAMINVAIAATALGVLSVGKAFAGLAQAGAQLEAAGHNVEQVFGSFSASIQEGAERQAKAFGQSKSEYLEYAATIGRELTKLGVHGDVAAQSATELLDAVQRLAQSQRISFGEAFARTQARGALFTENQLRAFAVEKGIITNRNMLLNESTEALLRNLMASERINETTEENAVAGDNWNAQIMALQGNLGNLAETIGKDLEPAFVAFLKNVNAWLQHLRAQWAAWREDIAWVVKLVAPELALMGGGGGGGPGAGPDLEKIDVRNKAAIDRAAKRQAVGEAMGRGGGGSAGGFQGGLVEFARRVQNAAFNQRQIGIQMRQLAALEQLVRLVAAGRSPEGIAAGALGGAAGLMAEAWK